MPLGYRQSDTESTGKDKKVTRCAPAASQFDCVRPGHGPQPASLVFARVIAQIDDTEQTEREVHARRQPSARLDHPSQTCPRRSIPALPRPWRTDELSHVSPRRLRQSELGAFQHHLPMARELKP